MMHYQRLFTLRITHSYFHTLVHPGLDLRPTGPTAQCMQRLGLFMRGSEGMWELFVRSDSPLWTTMESPILAEEPDSLAFELHVADPYFMLVTDLPLEASGRLRYSTDRASEQTNGFQLLGPSIVEEKMEPNLGLVSIRWDSLPTEIEQSGELNFLLAFESRPAYWKYHVVNPDHSAMVTGISGEDGSMAFSGPEEELLSNGKIARVYTCKSPILLKQPSSYSPKLSYQSNGTVQTLALPVPNRKGIRFEEIEGNLQAVANMYIYL